MHRATLPAVGLLLVLASSARAQEAFPAGEGEDPVRVLKELLNIESALLADAEGERLDGLAALRDSANGLSRAAAELSGVLERYSAIDPRELDAAEARDEIDQASRRLALMEREVERLIGESRAFGRRIQEHVARVEGLRQRLGTLEAEAPARRGPLAGRWSFRIDPVGDQGELVLRQFGTLIAGQYRLSSGRHGSIQGTFVADRLEVEVIDARFGRDSTLHGVHDGGRGTLAGTWEAIRLGTGRPAHGTWRAEKVVEEEPATPEAAQPEGGP